LGEQGDHAGAPGDESQVDGERAAPGATGSGLSQCRHEKLAVIE
jgi:hypothetical protein